jgi:hypothetical protein
LGFGLMAFCGAEVRRGFDEIAELLRLAEVVARSDLIIGGLKIRKKHHTEATVVTEDALNRLSASKRWPYTLLRVWRTSGRVKILVAATSRDSRANASSSTFLSISA